MFFRILLFINAIRKHLKKQQTLSISLAMISTVRKNVGLNYWRRKRALRNKMQRLNLKKMHHSCSGVSPSSGVILGLETICELASKYGPLVLGSSINNLFRRNTSFYAIKTNSV